MVRWRKHAVTAEVRQARRTRYQSVGYKRWIDPFPHIHGTLPEKMVYAELSKRGIPFLFLNDFKISISELQLSKENYLQEEIRKLKVTLEKK